MDMIYTVMNRFLFVMWMAGMLFLSSCSIKEDRDGCPCWMTVDLSDVAESRWESPAVQNNTEYQGFKKSPKSRSNVAEDIVLRLRGNSDEDEVDYSYQVTEELRANTEALEYEVPRGSVGVSAVNLARLQVPVGEQMDSLYGFFRMFYTRCESVLCNVELHKEFCNISFTLGDKGYVSPYDIEVWGNVAGVSAWDLMPLEGDFRYAPVPEDGVYRVRVPRQVDNSLELVMMENSEIVDRLPLGEYIARSGYDWAEEDLADVSVALDLERQQVMISVSDWDGVVVMDIVI